MNVYFGGWHTQAESRKDGCWRQLTLLPLPNTQPDVEVERPILEHAAVSQVVDTPFYCLEDSVFHSL